MKRLDPVQKALCALLGPGVFVRRDRKGRALFVSDAPRCMDPNQYHHVKTKLSGAGWCLEERDGLLLMDWPVAGYQQFLEQLERNTGPVPLSPAGDKAAIPGVLAILSRHSGAFTLEMLPLCRRALHLFDLEQTNALIVLAQESLAVALRKKTKPPSFFVPLLKALLAGPERAQKPQRRTISMEE